MLVAGIEDIVDEAEELLVGKRVGEGREGVCEPAVVPLVGELVRVATTFASKGAAAIRLIAASLRACQLSASETPSMKTSLSS